jgi:hypothetical protein
MDVDGLIRLSLGATPRGLAAQTRSAEVERAGSGGAGITFVLCSDACEPVSLVPR